MTGDQEIDYIDDIERLKGTVEDQGDMDHRTFIQNMLCEDNKQFRELLHDVRIQYHLLEEIWHLTDARIGSGGHLSSFDAGICLTFGCENPEIVFWVGMPVDDSYNMRARTWMKSSTGNRYNVPPGVDVFDSMNHIHNLRVDCEDIRNKLGCAESTRRDAIDKFEAELKERR